MTVDDAPADIRIEILDESSSGRGIAEPEKITADAEEMQKILQEEAAERERQRKLLHDLPRKIGAALDTFFNPSSRKNPHEDLNAAAEDARRRKRTDTENAAKDKAKKTAAIVTAAGAGLGDDTPAPAKATFVKRFKAYTI